MLWAALRARRLGGWKFRRQHVIAGYVVDFYCAELWLVVEVDGAVHEMRGDEDAQRDAILAALGVRVLRLSDVDVIERLAYVLDRLQRRCESIAHQRAIVRGTRQ